MLNEIGKEGKKILLEMREHRLLMRKQNHNNMLIILGEYFLYNNSNCYFNYLPLEILHEIIKRTIIPPLKIG